MSDMFKSGKALYKEGEALVNNGDLPAAFEKYKASAKKKYALGAYSCALMVFAGVKDGKVYTQSEYPDSERENDAYEHIKLAAELGHPESMAVLGEYLDRSFGNVTQDLEAAFKWYLRAEKAGFKDAIYYVARCYHSGKGVKKDEKTALKYYTKGHKLNDRGCTLEYASFLQEGKYIKQDLEKAFELFEKAAKADSRAAERRLGDCYENGLGVNTDYLKAAEWYLTSSEKGNKYAKKAYDELLLKIKELKTKKEETYSFLAVCYSRAIHGYVRNLDKAIENIYFALKMRFPEEPKTTEEIKLSEDSAMLFEKAQKKENDGRNYLSAIKTYLKAARTGHPLAAGKALRLAEKTGITEDRDEILYLAKRYNDPYLSNDIPRIIELVKKGDAEALEHIRWEKKAPHASPLYEAIRYVEAFIYAEELRLSPNPKAAMMVLDNQQYLDSEQIPDGIYELAETNGLFLFHADNDSEALRTGVKKAEDMIRYKKQRIEEEEREKATEEAQWDSYRREKILDELAGLATSSLVASMNDRERNVSYHNFGQSMTAKEAFWSGNADPIDYLSYSKERDAQINAAWQKARDDLRMKYLGYSVEGLERILKKAKGEF